MLVRLFWFVVGVCGYVCFVSFCVLVHLFCFGVCVLVHLFCFGVCV